MDVAQAQANDRVAVTTTRFSDYRALDAKFSPATLARLASLSGLGGVERTAEFEINTADGSLAAVQAQDRPDLSLRVARRTIGDGQYRRRSTRHRRHSRPRDEDAGG